MNTLLCVFIALLSIKAISCNGKVRGTNQTKTILQTITNARRFVTKYEEFLEYVGKNWFLKINGIDLQNDINKINGVLELSRELSDVNDNALDDRNATKTSFLLKYCYPMRDYALFQINGKLKTEIARDVLTHTRMLLEIFSRLTLPFLKKTEEKYINESSKKLLECKSRVENEFCRTYLAEEKELTSLIEDLRKINLDWDTLIDALKEDLFKQDLSKLIKMILLDPLHKCMHKSEIDYVLNPHTTLSSKLDSCLLKI